MKLLVLTKRHYMAKDIILEQYGRQFEVVSYLAQAGWEVMAFGLNYHSVNKKETMHAGGVVWHSFTALPFWHDWQRSVNRALRQWCPDVVLGCSDAVHISCAVKAAQSNRVPVAVDLHDNIASFGLTRVPGILQGYERAVERADILFCVSQPLRRKIESEYRIAGDIVLLENALPRTFGVDTPDKSLSRQQYGLPEESRIIGLAGALTRHRGMDKVLAGFEILKRHHPDLILALAGPTDGTGRQLVKDGIVYLGELDYESVPSFLRTLDVGIVPNVRPSFADYCYPQKVVEMCKMNVPIVAADLGVMKELAKGQKGVLYTADDPNDFARAVDYQIRNQVRLDVPIHTWAEQGERANKVLSDLVP